MPEYSPIDGLFQEGSIHSRVYSDPDLFQAERRALFARAWLYAGHESQLKHPGDFITGQQAGQPVLLLRDAE